jgi:hypothetical protein
MPIRTKKYRFMLSLVEYAPEEAGVYALWQGEEMIYVGRADKGQGIQRCLMEHLRGGRGPCTAKATHYTWEICLLPTVREAEILRDFREAHQREPRCNSRPR